MLTIDKQKKLTKKLFVTLVSGIVTNGAVVFDARSAPKMLYNPPAPAVLALRPLPISRGEGDLNAYLIATPNN